MKVKHRHLRAIKQFAIRDDVRPKINGVHFEPCKGGYIMAATDGRRLAVYFTTTEEQIPPPFTLRCDDLDFIPAKIENLDISVSGTTATVQAIHPSYMPKLVFEVNEAEFPKWRSVIPNDPMVPVDVNMASPIFEPFINCARVFCPGSPILYFRTHGKETSPISVFVNNYNFYGIIMPMRVESETFKKIPSWINDTTQNQAPV